MRVRQSDSGWRRGRTSRAAVAALAGLLLAAVGLAGCGPKKPALAPTTLPPEALVAQYDQRAAALPRLWSKCHLEIRVPKLDKAGRALAGKYDNYSLDGNFIIVKPRSLFLEGRTAFGDAVFGLYSNPEMYWMWVKPSVSAEWYGRYDGPGLGRFPLRPDLLMQTLPLFPIPADGRATVRAEKELDVIRIMSVPPDPGLPVRPPALRPAAGYVYQEISLDRYYHDAVSVRLNNARGEPLVISELQDYQAVQPEGLQTAVRVPMRLIYTFPQTDTRVRLELSNVKIPATVNERAFAYSQKKVDNHYNLDDLPQAAPAR